MVNAMGPLSLADFYAIEIFQTISHKCPSCVYLRKNIKLYINVEPSLLCGSDGLFVIVIIVFVAFTAVAADAAE